MSNICALVHRSVVIFVSCGCTNALPVTFAGNVFDGEVPDDFPVAFHDPFPYPRATFVNHGRG